MTSHKPTGTGHHTTGHNNVNRMADPGPDYASEPLVELHSHGGVALYEQTHDLRAAGPAVKVLLPEGVTAWSVTRTDVAKQLLTHPGVSKDARRSWPGYQPYAIAWLTAWVDVKSMFTTDDPHHRRFRDLVGKAFHPQRVDALRPAIEAIVADLLNQLDRTTRRGERVDVRAGYAYRLPTRLICDLFGVPENQRPAMLRVIDSVLDTTATPEQAAQTQHDLGEVMTRLVESKRRHPGEDMTSALLAAHLDDGDRLSEQELISTLILMIGAGSETAVSLITQAVRELLTHPAQLTTVMNNPSRWGDVIEETLRLRPPIMHLPLRYATENIHLHDDTTGNTVEIEAGDPILIGFGATGIDPAVHDDPETFNIVREDKTHLAFGHGIHYCLGAPLARLEAHIALPALFNRYPHLTLAEVGGPVPSFISNDIQALHVHLQPPQRRWRLRSLLRLFKPGPRLP